MYHIYEKTLKDKNNIYGIKQLEDDSNPFLEGPTVLTILALTLNEKNLNGAMRQTMEALGLKTSKNENSGLTIDKAPFKILSLSYGEKKENGFTFKNISKKSENTLNFVEKYFYPLICNKNKKLSLEEAQRNLRNVNIISYCDGTIITKEIEKSLSEKMKELNYSQEEINSALSQICSFPIADGIVKGDEKTTCISFKDLNDVDCRESLLAPTINEKLSSSDKNFDKVEIYNISDNEAMFLSKGDENFINIESYHEFKRYTQFNKPLSVGLSSVLTKAVDNSIKNHNNTEKFTPISCETLIQDLPQVIESIKKDLPKEDILKEINKNVAYLNSTIKESTEQGILDYFNSRNQNKNTNKTKEENHEKIKNNDFEMQL